MEYTKGEWKLDFSIDRWAEDLNDPSRYIKEKEDGIFNDLVSLDGDTVMEYAGCGSHQMQIHKEGDRFLIENAAVMFALLQEVNKDLGDKTLNKIEDFISDSGIKEITFSTEGLEDGKD